MGKTGDLFKKIRDTKGTFHAKTGTIKNRNSMDLNEAQDIKKMMLLKCCAQYTSKFGKLSSGHRTGKCQFSFQSQRKTMERMLKLLHNCSHLTR